jgi:uncharacterized protein YdaU (DUF1376 family)
LNYYRRYCGDYAAATPHLSLLEHGAYALMLDAYYTSERPLPVSYELLYRICRAQTPPEKKAVRQVAEEFFPASEDGEFRHNARADKELAIAVPKMEKLREVAHTNGKKGGRPPKQKPDPVSENNRLGINQETESGSKTKPDRKQPPTASHQPPENQTEKRIPGVDSTTAAIGTVGAAALAGLRQRLTLDQAKIPGGDETPAAVLASVLTANGLRGNAFHPAVVEWARDGITVDRLKAAIAKARQRPGKERGVFGPEYLSPILYDETKPAAQVYQERASETAAKAVDKTQKLIAEQRTRERSPMPEHLRPRVPDEPH